MMRPILTLKKTVVQTEQIELIIKTDSPDEPIGENLEEKKEEHAKEVDNKVSQEPKPVPPLVLRLCERFPNAFNLSNRKPLKVGINKEIVEIMRSEGAGSGVSLRNAIQWYTRGIKYQRAIIEQPHRLDLEGNAVEEITPYQRESAALEIKNIKHLQKKKNLAFKGKKKWHTKKKKTEQPEKPVLMDSCSMIPQDLTCLSGQINLIGDQIV